MPEEEEDLFADDEETDKALSGSFNSPPEFGPEDDPMRLELGLDAPVESDPVREALDEAQDYLDKTKGRDDVDSGLRAEDVTIELVPDPRGEDRMVWEARAEGYKTRTYLPGIILEQEAAVAKYVERAERLEDMQDAFEFRENLEKAERQRTRERAESGDQAEDYDIRQVEGVDSQTADDIEAAVADAFDAAGLGMPEFGKRPKTQRYDPPKETVHISELLGEGPSSEPPMPGLYKGKQHLFRGEGTPPTLMEKPAESEADLEGHARPDYKRPIGGGTKRHGKAEFIDAANARALVGDTDDVGEGVEDNLDPTTVNMPVSALEEKKPKQKGPDHKLAGERKIDLSELDEPLRDSLEMEVIEAVQNLGPIKLGKKLGQNEYGDVYRAVMPLPGESDLAQAVVRVSEVEAHVRPEMQAMRIVHENVLSVLDFGSHEGFNYVAFEDFKDAKTLDSKLKSGTTYNVFNAVTIVMQMLDGLSAAHVDDVYHGNLNPSAVLVDSKNDVKLRHFGLKPDKNDLEGSLDESGLRGVSDAVFRENEEDVGVYGDLYSAAMILSYMVTGEKEAEFSRTRFIEKMGDKGSVDLLAKAIKCAVNPKVADRYQSAVEFKRNLEDIRNFILEHEPAAKPTKEDKKRKLGIGQTTICELVGEERPAAEPEPVLAEPVVPKPEYDLAKAEQLFDRGMGLFNDVQFSRGLDPFFEALGIYRVAAKWESDPSEVEGRIETIVDNIDMEKREYKPLAESPFGPSLYKLLKSDKLRESGALMDRINRKVYECVDNQPLEDLARFDTGTKAFEAVYDFLSAGDRHGEATDLAIHALEYIYKAKYAKLQNRRFKDIRISSYEKDPTKMDGGQEWFNRIVDARDKAKEAGQHVELGALIQKWESLYVELSPEEEREHQVDLASLDLDDAESKLLDGDAAGSIEILGSAVGRYRSLGMEDDVKKVTTLMAERQWDEAKRLVFVGRSDDAWQFYEDAAKHFAEVESYKAERAKNEMVEKQRSEAESLLKEGKALVGCKLFDRAVAGYKELEKDDVIRASIMKHGKEYPHHFALLATEEGRGLYDLVQNGPSSDEFSLFELVSQGVRESGSDNDPLIYHLRRRLYRNVIGVLEQEKRFADAVGVCVDAIKYRVRGGVDEEDLKKWSEIKKWNDLLKSLTAQIDDKWEASKLLYESAESFRDRENWRIGSYIDDVGLEVGGAFYYLVHSETGHTLYSLIKSGEGAVLRRGQEGSAPALIEQHVDKLGSKFVSEGAELWQAVVEILEQEERYADAFDACVEAVVFSHKVGLYRGKKLATVKSDDYFPAGSAAAKPWAEKALELADKLEEGEEPHYKTELAIMRGVYQDVILEDDDLLIARVHRAKGEKHVSSREFFDGVSHFVKAIDYFGRADQTKEAAAVGQRAQTVGDDYFNLANSEVGEEVYKLVKSSDPDRITQICGIIDGDIDTAVYSGGYSSSDEGYLDGLKLYESVVGILEIEGKYAAAAAMGIAKLDYLWAVEHIGNLDNSGMGIDSLYDARRLERERPYLDKTKEPEYAKINSHLKAAESDEGLVLNDTKASVDAYFEWMGSEKKYEGVIEVGSKIVDEERKGEFDYLSSKALRIQTSIVDALTDEEWERGTELHTHMVGLLKDKGRYDEAGVLAFLTADYDCMGPENTLKQINDPDKSMPIRGFSVKSDKMYAEAVKLLNLAKRNVLGFNGIDTIIDIAQSRIYES